MKPLRRFHRRWVAQDRGPHRARSRGFNEHHGQAHGGDQQWWRARRHAEVERALSSLPGVTGLAVVGVPHPAWGQTVAALIEYLAAAPSLEQAWEEWFAAVPRHTAAAFGKGPVGVHTVHFQRRHRDTHAWRRERGSGNLVRVWNLPTLLVLIAAGNHHAVEVLLTATPSLAIVGLARSDEFFLAERVAQVYEGDTALHAASFSYDAEMARRLIACGADIRARNRRGAEPLHAATIGGPRVSTWNPPRQRDVILYLIEAGADPNASAAGGVTPLHRAVRNRCSVAVETLLRSGADPRLRSNSGSTAWDLARWTTGRGGSGTEAAKAEQQKIIDLLGVSSSEVSRTSGTRSVSGHR